MSTLDMRPCVNDPWLFVPVCVHVLKPFYLLGEPLKVGATPIVALHLAEEMAAIGKCEILAKPDRNEEP